MQREQCLQELPEVGSISYRKGALAECRLMQVIFTLLPHHYDRAFTLQALRRWWVTPNAIEEDVNEI
jgi:hypothetical protein